MKSASATMATPMNTLASNMWCPEVNESANRSTSAAKEHVIAQEAV
jgi:hypothetical protein